MSWLGLIVNPIAGMGGRVGLKGTDGREILRLARQRGAVPVAPARTSRALARLRLAAPEVRVLAGAGSLGAELARGHGFDTEQTDGVSSGTTTAQDTRDAVARMVERGLELLVFAGGDGTARDVLDVVGRQVPVLGIPTGVKMHSGVFASTPEAAGEVAARFLLARRGSARLRDGEVADVDEEAVRAGRIATRLYGVMRVPVEPSRMIGAKTSGMAGDDAALDGVAARLVDGMEPGRLYLLGPGTSTGRIAAHLSIQATLLGVDVVQDRALLAADVAERDILRLLDTVGRPATLVVGITGGQGYVLGRGNQQLSAEVIRRIGAENVTIIGGLRKLTSLSPPVLHVDTGEERVDRMLAGYRRVLIGPERDIVMKVSA